MLIDQLIGLAPKNDAKVVKAVDDPFDLMAGG
jgi:hypothetical protein